jgi:hypothetical protein
MDEHAMMRKLIDLYTDSYSLPPSGGEGWGGGLDGDDWLRLKRHLASCRACDHYMAAAQRLEQTLAERPPLAQPLGFVHAVLRSLPPTLATPPPRPAWRGRALVAALALVGLILMLVPDTYLLNLLTTWLGDASGTVSSAGQGISDWVSNPSLGAGNFASELFSQHQIILLGLCTLTIALCSMLYQALSAPLPERAERALGR